MPQNLGHLGQRSSSAKQMRGEREPKEVGPARRWVEAGARERSFDDGGDGLVGPEPTNRRFETNEHSPCRTSRPPPTQIGGHRRADVSWERETLVTRALASDHKLACLPVDVV